MSAPIEALAPVAQVDGRLREQHALRRNNAQHAHVDVELVAQLLRAAARVGSRSNNNLLRLRV